MQKSILKHPFKPIIFNDSNILILGTFPSIKSFKNNFYYAHPRNQFWDILSKIFNEKKPLTTNEKIDFLKKHKIALWDVICECIRKENRSTDDNLEILKPCDIKNLLKNYPNIKKIATTSRLAQKLLKKHFNINSIYLTSPSPLNTRVSFKQKVKIWKELLESM